MKQRIIYIFTLAVLLASCSQDEALPGGGNAGNLSALGVST